MIASLTMLAALAAGTPFLTPGTYHYVATLAGQTAATSTLTVARDNNGTKIDEDSSGSLGTARLAGKATLELNGNLTPSEYTGVYSSGQQNMNVTVAVAPASATVVSSMAGGQPQTLALMANTSHFAVIEPGLLAGLFALPAQMELWKDAGVTAIAPIMGRAQPLLAGTPSPAPSRPNDVPAGDEALSISTPVVFTIWYDPTTYVPDEIVIPSQDATITRIRQS